MKVDWLPDGDLQIPSSCLTTFCIVLSVKTLFAIFAIFLILFIETATEVKRSIFESY
jgi:hypothetical protein